MRVKQFWTTILCGLIFVVGLSSCNTTPEDDPDYVVSSNVAVSNFYLKNNGKILSSIDSVFFSIDLKKRIIFNADSLPKGTDVTRLIPVITLPGAAKSVTLTMVGGAYRTGEVDYIKNPTDSIDFTGDVTLTIVAQDGVSVCDYKVKVNVHNMEPDSLWWDKLAVAELPSRLPSPKKQKTIEFADKIVTYVMESDGSFTMSYIQNPATGDWVKQQIDFGFEPDLRSAASVLGKVYMLSKNGELCESNDGVLWQPTGIVWRSIIGGYEDKLLGLKNGSDGIYHAEYPIDVEGAKVDAEFPVKGFSILQTYSNKWIDTPIGFVTGGKTNSGRLTGATWGYDGENWAKLSSNPVPAVEDGTMIPYFVFRNNSQLWHATEYNIWLFVGGKKEDGTLNDKVYMSYDNGVNWSPANELMQFPEYIPAMCCLDNIVVSTTMTGNFEPKAWKSKKSKVLPSWYRVNYHVDGYDVTWECPYIYLFGGENLEGEMYNTIWKGVINRLTFVPIF